MSGRSICPALTASTAFTDGNGRVGRLLSLLLLYHFDYQVGRYISLERIIEESRETYYEALDRSSRGWHEQQHDVHPWLHYFWGVLIRAYDEFEARVETLKGSKGDQVRAAVARRIGAFGIADLEQDCPGVSRDMVRPVLRQMRTEGLVQVKGCGPGVRWWAVTESSAGRDGDARAARDTSRSRCDRS